MIHHINLFDLQNEIKRMESTPIETGTKKKAKPLTEENTVTIDLSQNKYRTLVIDIYGVDILNRLLSKTATTIFGMHNSGGKYEFKHIKDNTWKVTEYILE